MYVLDSQLCPSWTFQKHVHDTDQTNNDASEHGSVTSLATSLEQEPCSESTGSLKQGMTLDIRDFFNLSRLVYALSYNQPG